MEVHSFNLEAVSGVPVNLVGGSLADNRLHSGKEWQNFGGISWYDNLARMMSPVFGRFTTPDPLAEKYYSMSPYAYCAGNPLMLVDPSGMDVWEINYQGEIVKRITDKTQDALYMVAKNSDGEYERTYIY
ncbi:MAG: hypothetical protein PHR45_07170 [Muribaculaceae bacterium]|nr:hypothetical protein [Muribaculaceae bacterium]